MLKLDPKNTELLNQKQTILNQQIEQTRNKLTTLQQIKEEADKKMAEGTQINEENYRALQREITNTETKLKNLELMNDPFYKFGKNAEELGNKINGISSKIDNLGNKLTTRVTLPIATGFTLMTKSAIENETAMQQVDKIYGKASESIKNFAENQAINYNMSSSEAYKYSQIYGNLIQSITDDESKNAKYTQDLLKASAVIASSTGRTMEDVMDRIRSGLLGNTEAIEDLGVNVNVALLQSTDAFKKFAGDKSWNQLDFQTQQQIRLFGILEQTTKKYGDEINQNTASDIQQLTAKTKNLTNNLGKKLMPTATKLIDKANNLIDKFGDLSDEEQENIIKIGLMVAAAGPFIKIVGNVGKVLGTTTKGIGIFTQAIGVMKTGAKSSSDTVNKLSGVLKGLANPAGLALAGITAVTAGIVYFNTKETEAQKQIKEFANEMANSKKEMDEFNKSIDDTTNANIAQIDSCVSLKEELKTLVDENGKVKEGYEGRVNFILKQLNEALGTEYKLNGDIIESYKDLQEEIDATMEKKKAEVFLNAEEEKYKEAVQNQKQAVEDLTKARENLNGKTIEQLKVELAAAETTGRINKTKANEIRNQIQAYEDVEYRVKTYTENVKAYTEDYENFVKGNYDEINNKITTSTQDWTKNTLAEIQNSIVEQSNALENYKKTYEETGNEVAKQSYEQAQANLQSLTDELISRTNTIGTLGKDEIMAWATLASNNYEVFKEKMAKLPPETQEKLKAIADVVTADSSVINNMEQLAESAEQAFKSNDSTKWGEDMITKMAQGILNKTKTDLKKSVSGASNLIASFLHFSRPDVGPLHEYEKWMPDMVEGLAETLDKSSPRLMKSTERIAKKMRSLLSFEAQSLKPIINNIQTNQIIDRTVYTTPNIVINANDELTPNKINTIFDAINRRLGSQY